MPSPVLSPRRRSKIASMTVWKSQRSIAQQFNIAQSTVSYCVALSKAAEAIPHALQQAEDNQQVPFIHLQRVVKLDCATLEVGDGAHCTADSRRSRNSVRNTYGTPTLASFRGWLRGVSSSLSPPFAKLVAFWDMAGLWLPQSPSSTSSRRNKGSNMPTAITTTWSGARSSSLMSAISMSTSSTEHMLPGQLDPTDLMRSTFSTLSGE